MLIEYPGSRNLFCIMRLWFRHIGFGLGFTSLLLKTDRQLSQRLAPILALYIVYLLAWSLAKPSHVIEMKMSGGLRFEECSVDWWDHAILICEYAIHFFYCGEG